MSPATPIASHRAPSVHLRVRHRPPLSRIRFRRVRHTRVALRTLEPSDVRGDATRAGSRRRAERVRTAARVRAALSATARAFRRPRRRPRAPRARRVRASSTGPLVGGNGPKFLFREDVGKGRAGEERIRHLAVGTTTVNIVRLVCALSVAETTTWLTVAVVAPRPARHARCSPRRALFPRARTLPRAPRRPQVAGRVFLEIIRVTRPGFPPRDGTAAAPPPLPRRPRARRTSPRPRRASGS